MAKWIEWTLGHNECCRAPSPRSFPTCNLCERNTFTKHKQHRWDDNACLGERNTSSIGAWANSLDRRPPKYCIVSPLLKKRIYIILNPPLDEQVTVQSGTVSEAPYSKIALTCLLGSQLQGSLQQSAFHGNPNSAWQLSFPQTRSPKQSWSKSQSPSPLAQGFCWVQQSHDVNVL